MSASERAVAAFARQYPNLPPEAAPVFLLLCAENNINVPGIARRLDLAQSTALRLLALLEAAGLVEQSTKPGRAVRYNLAAGGRRLAVEVATELSTS